jgi:hypothetical protein
MWSSFQMKQLTGLLKGIHCLINKKMFIFVLGQNEVG